MPRELSCPPPKEATTAKTTRRARFAIGGAVVAAAAALLPGGAAGHKGGVVLYGSGTAVLDGVLAPGEWEHAHALTFDVYLPQHDGGGTAPVTVRAMNDSRNLYVSVEVPRGAYGLSTTALLAFDNNHDGLKNDGDDYLMASVDASHPVTFTDGFDLRRCESFSIWCGPEDRGAGGTTDGAAAASANGSTTVLELSHTLDSADDAHDFSLSAPNQVVGFSLYLLLGSTDLQCTSACFGGAVFPAMLHEPDHFGDLVVAPDTVAPETEIVSFNDELTRSRTAEFAYDGTDNVTFSDQLVFSCSLDGSAYRPCQETLRVSSGRHRLLARARDEAGNVDASPAVFRWRVDLTRPRRPTVGLRVSGSRIRVALSSRDRDDPARTLTFLCAVDRARLRHCRVRFTQPVRGGTHVLRTRAADPAGNTSATTITALPAG